MTMNLFFFFTNFKINGLTTTQGQFIFFTRICVLYYCHSSVQCKELLITGLAWSYEDHFNLSFFHWTSRVNLYIPKMPSMKPRARFKGICGRYSNTCVYRGMCVRFGIFSRGLPHLGCHRRKKWDLQKVGFQPTIKMNTFYPMANLKFQKRQKME